MTWSHNNLPINEPALDPNTLLPTGLPILPKQDQSTFQAQLAKTTAEGGRVYVGTEIDYNNTVGYTAPLNPFFNSSWTSDVTVGFNQPLLQGAGAQYNRIAGPYNPFLGIGSRQFNGVMLARINTDITLADFEANVRNLVFDVENAYWELYFGYRNLESSKVALTSSLKTWQRVKVLGDAGLPGGAAKDEDAGPRTVLRLQVAASGSQVQPVHRRKPSAIHHGAFGQRRADDPPLGRADFRQGHVLLERGSRRGARVERRICADRSGGSSSRNWN